MLECRRLHKIYRGSVALDNVSCLFRPGITGVVGANGAGKSTLLRLLATLSRPSSGQVLWRGQDVARDPDRLRAELGYLPQHFGVYPRLTAAEFLHYLAALRGLAGPAARGQVAALLEALGLAADAERPLATYSGGMLQRIGIAQALLGSPRLILLDEPATGLDPVERARLRQLLSGLAEESIVLLSTHVLSDLEALADTLLLLRGGRLLWRGAPADLLRCCRGQVWEVLLPRLPHRPPWPVTAAVRTADGVRLRLVAATPPPEAEPAVPTLEDACTWALAQPEGRIPC